MKVLGNLDIVKKVDATLPFGYAIQNETDTKEGTPVVDDILQDILSNLYKLLELTNINPTNDFDNNSTQYQIVDALKRLPNVMNDVEQVMSLDGTVWSIDLDIDIIPDKYFCIVRAEENYNSDAEYTFKGVSETEYSFTSSNFSTGDLLLTIIDQSGVRAYPLALAAVVDTSVITPFGNPISYNDSAKMYYQQEGYLLSDTPSSNDLLTVLQSDLSDSTLILNDVFVMSGVVFCFCLIPGTNEYFFRKFINNNFSSSVAAPITGASFGTSDDFQPYVYADKLSFIVTNGMNTTASDNVMKKISYNALTGALTYSSTVTIDASFVKTSNAAVKTSQMYTLISGELNKFNLISGAKTVLGTYPTVAGQLFTFNKGVYFCSGEVAKQWF